MLDPNNASMDDNYVLSGYDDDGDDNDKEEGLVRTVTEKVDRATHTGSHNLGSTHEGILSAYQLPGPKEGIVVLAERQLQKRCRSRHQQLTGHEQRLRLYAANQSSLMSLLSRRSSVPPPFPPLLGSLIFLT